MVTQLFRLAAWCSLLLLAIASWTPKARMVRSGFSGDLEHVVAYAVAAIAYAIAYRWLPMWRIVGGLSAYAAVMEIGQTWVPGREPSIANWAAGSAGACLIMIPVWFRSVQARRSKPTAR